MTDEHRGIEVRHLRALATVAETRSFSRAAVELGYAQSAVSQQISALERIVGFTLVERPGGPKPVALTPAGEILARHAERVLARLRAATADLQALAAGEAGTVRVGVFQSVGARVLPEVLARYRAAWPRVRVELHESQDDMELRELVVAGALDLTYAADADDDPRFDGVPLLDEPFVVLVPPASPLAGRTSIRLADLDGADAIGFTTGGLGGQAVLEAVRRSGAQTNVVFRSDDNLTVQRLVGVGVGIAVLPELAVEHGEHAGPARILEIVGTVRPRRRIIVLTSRDRQRSTATESFIRLSVEAFTAEAERRGVERLAGDVASR